MDGISDLTGSLEHLGCGFSVLFVIALNEARINTVMWLGECIFGIGLRYQIARQAAALIEV